MDTGIDRQTELMNAYLRRLGLEAEPPSVDALFRIHRAQVERVPYETTWIPLGERWSVDTDAAFERIAEHGAADTASISMARWASCCRCWDTTSRCT